MRLPWIFGRGVGDVDDGVAAGGDDVADGADIACPMPYEGREGWQRMVWWPYFTLRRRNK